MSKYGDMVTAIITAAPAETLVNVFRSELCAAIEASLQVDPGGVLARLLEPSVNTVNTAPAFDIAPQVKVVRMDEPASKRKRRSQRRKSKRASLTPLQTTVDTVTRWLLAHPNSTARSITRGAKVTMGQLFYARIAMRKSHSMVKHGGNPPRYSIVTTEK